MASFRRICMIAILARLRAQQQRRESCAHELPRRSTGADCVRVSNQRGKTERHRQDDLPESDFARSLTCLPLAGQLAFCGCGGGGGALLLATWILVVCSCLLLFDWRHFVSSAAAATAAEQNAPKFLLFSCCCRCFGGRLCWPAFGCGGGGGVRCNLVSAICFGDFGGAVGNCNLQFAIRFNSFRRRRRQRRRQRRVGQFKAAVCGGISRLVGLVVSLRVASRLLASGTCSLGGCATVRRGGC